MTTTDESVLIDCPAHPGEHWAALDTYPSTAAGIWECPRGDSDTCEHEETEIESVTTDYMRNGEPDQYETKVYVCSLCGVIIEDRDPAADRADYLADMEIDRIRDK